MFSCRCAVWLVCGLIYFGLLRVGLVVLSKFCDGFDVGFSASYCVFWVLVAVVFGGYGGICWLLF